MNKKTDISKNLNNEQENHARSLLKNLLKLGENPESLKDIFSLEINKSIQENLSLYNFLKSYSHNKLFDHAVEISTEDEKKQLNEIFKNQDPKNPLSFFHEAPKDSTYLEKQHKVVANILRRHLSSNYTMLNEFSGLREQIYKFYKDSPIILFKKCKSIAHYKLLTEKMNFPTEQANKEKDTLVNLKLIALYN
ncbi:MAG: hypothetical protein RSC93_14200, partial [Erysipelotrichaceae bacterium]